jgi:hypothetical protein
LLGERQTLEQYRFGAGRFAQRPQCHAEAAERLAQRQRIGAPTGQRDRVFEHLPGTAIVALASELVAALDELFRDLR